MTQLCATAFAATLNPLTGKPVNWANVYTAIRAQLLLEPTVASADRARLLSTPVCIHTTTNPEVFEHEGCVWLHENLLKTVWKNANTVSDFAHGVLRTLCAPLPVHPPTDLTSDVLPFVHVALDEEEIAQFVAWVDNCVHNRPTPPWSMDIPSSVRFRPSAWVKHIQQVSSAVHLLQSDLPLDEVLALASTLPDSVELHASVAQCLRAALPLDTGSQLTMTQALAKQVKNLDVDDAQHDRMMDWLNGTTFAAVSRAEDHPDVQWLHLQKVWETDRAPVPFATLQTLLRTHPFTPPVTALAQSILDLAVTTQTPLPDPVVNMLMLGHCDMLPSAFGLLTPSQEKQVRVHAASGFLPQLQRVLDGLNPPNVVRFPTKTLFGVR